MPDQMPDLGQLVEIKGISEGTGFLIADGLILTAWHLLRPPPGELSSLTVRVRIQRDLKRGMPIDTADKVATRLWPQGEPGEDMDFALLRFSPSENEKSREEGQSAVAWASLGHWGVADVIAVGYPDMAIDSLVDRRDTKGIAGWIQLADNVRSLAEGRGTLTIRLRDEDVPAEPAAIAWPAMSGAPVFAGGVLVGLVRIAGEDRSRHQLHALPVDRLLGREDVVKAIRDAGYAVPSRVVLNSTGSGPARTFSSAWNVPYQRNFQFTGRSEVIARLWTDLSSGPAAVTQAIAGLGGIGKTQLALEYCYRHRESYKVIWWIRAENEETRTADLVALGQKLSLTDTENPDRSGSVSSVVEWLNQNRDWLLVFDNVEKPSDLTGVLPTSGTGHILITSRYATWGSQARIVTLNVWTSEEASQYLLKRTEQADTPDNRRTATALAEVLGCLPLAIEQAAAYIDECKMGVVEYKNLFAKHLLQRKRSQQTGDVKTVATVWEISLRRVESESPGAVALLTLCAFMRPDQISKEKVEKYHSAMPEPLRTTASNTIALHDAIAVLRRYSLISATDQFISVHRLVQLVVGSRLDPEVYQKFSELARRLESDVDDFQDTVDSVPPSLTRREILTAGVAAGILATAGFLTYQIEDPAKTSEKRKASPLIEEPIPDLFEIADKNGTIVAITTIAARSKSAVYQWQNRGKAPIGYTKGMALVFAKVYLKLKAGDAAAREMAKADSGDKTKDALAFYAGIFADAGMPNAISGPDTLRHLFVLLIGLGMSESSGKYCAGRDLPSASTGGTAEAGLFQSNFIMRSASPLLMQLFSSYLANPSGFVEIFREGVACSFQDFQNVGSGDAEEFQRLSKECPAFAVEYAAICLRNLRTSYGPINRKAVQVSPEYDAMLRQVEKFVDEWPNASAALGAK